MTKWIYGLMIVGVIIMTTSVQDRSPIGDMTIMEFEQQPSAH